MQGPIWTVPNQITLLRLGFLPFFLILISYEQYRWALLVLVAAGLSDGVDGLLARKLNQRSPLGAYLDPIADKLLLSSSFHHSGVQTKTGVVADHHRAQPRCANTDGCRGDTSHFRLPPVSAQHLWKADHRFTDSSGVHGRFVGGLSTSCIHSCKSLSDLCRDGHDGIFRFSLFVHYFEAA